MKPITLKEFAELAKNDEALKEKLLKSVKPGEGGTQELIDLAAEYGYELTEEGIYSILEDEEMSDEELKKIAGGVDPVVFWGTICEAIWVNFFGFDSMQCYD